MCQPETPILNIKPMPETKRKDIGKIMSDGKAIDAAIKQAAREAVLKHKQVGQPLVGMKNGKIVWVNPEDIDV